MPVPLPFGTLGSSTGIQNVDLPFKEISQECWTLSSVSLPSHCRGLSFPHRGQPLSVLLLGEETLLLKALGLGQQSPRFLTWSSTRGLLSRQASFLQGKGSLQKRGGMQMSAHPSAESTMHGIKSTVKMTLKPSSCHFSCPVSQPELTSSRMSSPFFECDTL